MNIDETLDFGKYKGLSIIEIYQGVCKVDRFFVEEYIRTKLNSDYDMDRTVCIGEVLSFEVSDTLIRATPFDLSLNGNYAKNISALFKKVDSYNKRIVGNVSFDEFIAVNEIDNKRFICNGNPEYIDWCINTNDLFYVNPFELDILEEMEVSRYKEMEITFKIEDIYTYTPHFLSEKYKFSPHTIKKNYEKFLQLESDDDDEDDELYEDTNRDYFDAMTDGQLGSYDDFDGTSDDLDNWGGR